MCHRNKQQKVTKPKVKKKTLLKRVPSTKKLAAKDDSNKSAPVKKAKLSTTKSKTVKAAEKSSSNESDDDSEHEDDADDNKKTSTKSSTEQKTVPTKKFKKPSIRKTSVAKVTADVKDVVVRKRMASLNASAMMAATYEVERQLDKSEALYKHHRSDSDEQVAVAPKKPKDIKDEILEQKDVRIKLNHNSKATKTF